MHLLEGLVLYFLFFSFNYFPGTLGFLLFFLRFLAVLFEPNCSD